MFGYLSLTAILIYYLYRRKFRLYLWIKGSLVRMTADVRGRISERMFKSLRLPETQGRFFDCVLISKAQVIAEVI